MFAVRDQLLSVAELVTSLAAGLFARRPPHAPAEDGWPDLLDRAVQELSDFVIVMESTASPRCAPRVVYANPAFLAAVGYSAEELSGQELVDLFTPCNSPALISRMLANAESGLPNELEACVQRRDGTTFWMEFSTKPIVCGSIKRAYRLCVGRDMTLRKRAANQVALLMAAIDAATEPVILYEVSCEGALEPSYENGAAASAGRYRLLEILASPSPVADELRDGLARGGIRLVVDDTTSSGAASACEFSVRAIRNPSGSLEAVVTVERALS